MQQHKALNDIFKSALIRLTSTPRQPRAKVKGVQGFAKQYAREWYENSGGESARLPARVGRSSYCCLATSHHAGVLSSTLCIRQMTLLLVLQAPYPRIPSHTQSHSHFSDYYCCSSFALTPPRDHRALGAVSPSMAQPALQKHDGNDETDRSGTLLKVQSPDKIFTGDPLGFCDAVIPAEPASHVLRESQSALVSLS